MAFRASVGTYSSLWRKYGRNLGCFVRTFYDNRRVFVSGARPCRGPLVTVFNLSSKCDAKCRFCGYWSVPSDQRKELSTEEKIRVVDDLAKSGVWLLSLCSAEPLLSKDLDKVIESAKKKNLLVNISTNGSMLEEKAQMIARTGVDTVTVSIDSHDPEVHDYMRGYAGLFDRVKRGIERLRSLRRKKRPWIIARHLVNARTYFALEDFIRYWREMVDEIILKPVCVSFDGIFNIPEDMRARPEDEGRFRKYFNGLLRKYPSLDVPYHRVIPDYLFGGTVDDNYYCFSGTFFTDVDREGNIYPCTESGKSFGNMLKEDFLDIWRSDRMADFRKSLKEKKKCSRCWGDKFMSGMNVQKIVEISGGLR